MDKLSRFVYEFAGFQLDVNQQLLVSPAGSSIPLPSRAFDVLRYLVERPGELVEKAALMKAVWPRAVVEENNLSQCIMAVRRALGDEVGERRFVLTVPGRGYKFVAPVQVLSDSPWQTPAIAVPPIEVPVARPGPAAEARPTAHAPARAAAGGRCRRVACRWRMALSRALANCSAARSVRTTHGSARCRNCAGLVTGWPPVGFHP